MGRAYPRPTGDVSLEETARLTECSPYISRPWVWTPTSAARRRRDAFLRFDTPLPMADSSMGMIGRRFSLWQKAVALAPVLLLLVYLPGQMLLRCRIDGLLRSACCCPPETESQSSQPVVKAQDCCDREVTQNQRPAAEAARAPNRDAAPTAVMALAAAPAPFAPFLAEPTPQPDRAAQRHGPAPDGPRLVLLKQSFLI